MKKTCLPCIIFFLVLFLVNCAIADSPVWKVVKGNHQIFIGGTIHVLTKSDYPLPSSFDKAYNESSIIVFETDLQKIQTPEFQQSLLSKATYSDGNSLKTLLSNDTYNKLDQHLATRGIPIANLMNFKVGMVSLTLTVIELQRLGLIGAGVDEYYGLRAINERKRIDHLETIDEQITFISKMGDGQENELIEYTLNDLKRLPELMMMMKDAWRVGDLKQLNEIFILPLKAEFPLSYEQLIVKRNNDWVPKLEAMMDNKESEFVLVGALHLVGEDSVLSQLNRRGYEIRQY